MQQDGGGAVDIALRLMGAMQKKEGASLDKLAQIAGKSKEESRRMITDIERELTDTGEELRILCSTHENEIVYRLIPLEKIKK
ncbi:MAG: hypothetical protein KDI13_00705 [Alphaproteobacteria bacterium]|nr:hypothetical protein [Alphaproteobacteria bacterium]